MTIADLRNNLDQAIAAFRQLSVDDQLALLWYVYEKMGDSVTPAAPGAASPEIAEGLFNQMREMDHAKQLQAMRDLAAGNDTLISREYSGLSANTKLAFWFRLAQGMEDGTIVPMPENYQMTQQVQELLTALESSEFNDQITFLRSTVEPMGTQPREGAQL